jgi:hypothetical protein
MTKLAKLFDEQWMQTAQTATSESWAHEVLATVDTTGGLYFCQLRRWFNEFPLTAAPKQHLRQRLENLDKEVHLGAVNELAWWALMRRQAVIGEPISASGETSPDFKLTSPFESYVEVSTLNVSFADSKRWKANTSVDLQTAKSETLRRIASIASEPKKKLKQLKYAAAQERPCILALFDYTTWSGFGTQFFRDLGEFLLGKEFGFKGLPSALSALVYLERRVNDGWNEVSCDRSAVYYNPLALIPITVGILPCFSQFATRLTVTDPSATEHWLRL